MSVETNGFSTSEGYSLVKMRDKQRFYECNGVEEEWSILIIFIVLIAQRNIFSAMGYHYFECLLCVRNSYALCMDYLIYSSPLPNDVGAFIILIS